MERCAVDKDIYVCIISKNVLILEAADEPSTCNIHHIRGLFTPYMKTSPPGMTIPTMHLSQPQVARKESGVSNYLERLLFHDSSTG